MVSCISIFSFIKMDNSYYFMISLHELNEIMQVEQQIQYVTIVII